MITVENPMSMAEYTGVDLGVTEWLEITQAQIDGFAALSGDDHWVHVDTERAAREQPDGRTIAHGLYLLALIPRLQRQLFLIEKRGAGLNYGYDKIRFTAPVPVGSSIRLRQAVGEVTARGAGARMELHSTIEVQHADKAALVANGILWIANA